MSPGGFYSFDGEASTASLSTVDMRRVSHYYATVVASGEPRMTRAVRDALPRREREIMNALFALGNRATAEEIRARLADPPTGSSVRVMLARLEKKGQLR